ncbi:hypothetical protein V9T40_001302 [Parthenolecanium corni]|uniref:Uncharacterized protein n=1 Tax=Parthenolecanium corni TaxID=536013 RepID=A0AAN9TAZ4_9HEMI
MEKGSECGRCKRVRESERERVKKEEIVLKPLKCWCTTASSYFPHGLSSFSSTRASAPPPAVIQPPRYFTTPTAGSSATSRINVTNDQTPTNVCTNEGPMQPPLVRKCSTSDGREKCTEKIDFQLFTTRYVCCGEFSLPAFFPPTPHFGFHCIE